jgi:hypothetical protein
MTEDLKLMQCVRTLTVRVGRLMRSLSPRERLALKVGLSASHAEEALTQGDMMRARAHVQKLLKLARQLEDG